ncbi:hypothetical protein HO173_012235 [Letharia columbiana]|uniref:Uncharacterized protein n=1 Tax=Letharia columbiana TaxID=112416 RepID=A0A8H6FGK3_9LECA|nr:uncharacterized protein HO173_012235 [Letharia columbiana]KAF6227495.1 hypothetical protein HO173_012235 [Letharia columbiana]
MLSDNIPTYNELAERTDRIGVQRPLVGEDINNSLQRDTIIRGRKKAVQARQVVKKTARRLTPAASNPAANKVPTLAIPIQVPRPPPWRGPIPRTNTNHLVAGLSKTATPLAGNSTNTFEGIRREQGRWYDRLGR